MRTPPFGTSVELPMGPRSAALGGGDARERRRCSLRWSSLWGHEQLYWVEEMHANSATEVFGGSLWAHDML
eukprot:2371999-Pyramimonas_sp.AAC.1